MSWTATIRTIIRDLNILEFVGIVLALFMAFAFQIIFHELPCPLCLLQRIGLIGIAFGFLMNLRFGPRPSHYAISILSGIFTSFVALRQISLHVIPGEATYGNAFFGLHLYTWAFILSMSIVIATTVMLAIDRQYKKPSTRIRLPRTTHLLFTIMMLLIIANIVSVWLECGFAQCPDNPTEYKHKNIHSIY